MTNDDRKSKIRVIRSNSENLMGENAFAKNSMTDEEIEKELSDLRGECRRNLKSINWDGVLWFRNLQHKEDDSLGDVFTKAYAALENGRIYFYKNKDEYYHFASTIADGQTIKLLDYELESNAKRVSGLDTKGVSLNKSFRAALFGTDELSFMDMMGADFDVASATSNYKFCLIPKVRYAACCGIRVTR